MGRDSIRYKKEQEVCLPRYWKSVAGLGMTFPTRVVSRILVGGGGRAARRQCTNRPWTLWVWRRLTSWLLVCMCYRLFHSIVLCIVVYAFQRLERLRSRPGRSGREAGRPLRGGSVGVGQGPISVGTPYHSEYTRTPSLSPLPLAQGAKLMTESVLQCSQTGAWGSLCVQLWIGLVTLDVALPHIYIHAYTENLSSHQPWSIASPAPDTLVTSPHAPGPPKKFPVVALALLRGGGGAPSCTILASPPPPPTGASCPCPSWPPSRHDHPRQTPAPGPSSRVESMAVVRAPARARARGWSRWAGVEGEGEGEGEVVTRSQ